MGQYGEAEMSYGHPLKNFVMLGYWNIGVLCISEQALVELWKEKWKDGETSSRKPVRK